MKRAWNGATETTAALSTYLFPGPGRRASSFSMVDLYQFTLPFGASGTPPATVLSFAGSEVDLVFEGVAYPARASQLSRGNCKTVVGVEVDTLDVTIAPQTTTGAADVIPGTSVAILQAIQRGLFDGAAFTLRRLYLATPPVWGTPIDPSLGAVTLFAGQVRDIEVQRTKAVLTMASGLEQLRAPIPRNTYQPGCANSLYDGICNLSKTGSAGGQSFQASGTVVAASSTVLSITLASAPTQPDGYFDLGYLEVSAGAFRGLRRTIKRHVGAVVSLIQPLPFALPNTQAVVLQAGCDKQVATCVAKFDNRGNFRGQPYIPQPDNAL